MTEKQAADEIEEELTAWKGRPEDFAAVEQLKQDFKPKRLDCILDRHWHSTLDSGLVDTDFVLVETTEPDFTVQNSKNTSVVRENPGKFTDEYMKLNFKNFDPNLP